jgi:hypothetical protein
MRKMYQPSPPLHSTFLLSAILSTAKDLLFSRPEIFASRLPVLAGSGGSAVRNFQTATQPIRTC